VAVAGMDGYQLRPAVYATAWRHTVGRFDFLGVGSYVCGADGCWPSSGALLAGRGATA